MSKVIFAVRYRILPDLVWTPVAFFLNYNKAIEYERWESERNLGLPFEFQYDTMEFASLNNNGSNSGMEPASGASITASINLAAQRTIPHVSSVVHEVQFVQGGSVRLEPDTVEDKERCRAEESGSKRHAETIETKQYYDK